MARKEEKDVRSLLSDLGFMFEIFKVLIHAVLKLGGTREDLKRLVKEPTLVDEIAKLIVVAKSAVTLSFADFLAACKQSSVNEICGGFTEENFPLEPVADDENEWKVCEHCFLKEINGFDAFRQLEEDPGYRFCGPRRAMEYVAEHPDGQLNYSLIVTTRVNLNACVCYVPIFHRTNDQRGLDIFKLDADFGPSYSWLVLKRKDA